MILEQAVLTLSPAGKPTFEGAFSQAAPIISAMPGFISLTLHRCIERTFRFLLLVQWERLEDHTEGFRGSPEYQQWRALLHHFYDPFPTVEHYDPVAVGSP